MKILVLCDEQGEIQSVVFPDRALAGQLSVESDRGGRVYELEVDGDEINEEMLRGARSEETREAAFRRLRRMISERDAGATAG